MSDIKIKQLTGSGAVAPLLFTKQYAVTPSDSTTFEPSCIFVGTGGNIAIVSAETATVLTYKNIPSGSFLPVLAVQVYSANTLAEDIIRGN